MRPTRQTQPFRTGPRAPGQALSAMLRGRSMSGGNSADILRAAQKRAKPSGRSRPARPARPPRPR